ncbi:hypothetical protein HOD29_04960 [archaeon]|jgi:hypothetical protein|nr:hypothetical protein [archaeon]
MEKLIKYLMGITYIVALILALNELSKFSSEKFWEQFPIFIFAIILGGIIIFKGVKDLQKLILKFKIMKKSILLTLAIILGMNAFSQDTIHVGKKFIEKVIEFPLQGNATMIDGPDTIAWSIKESIHVFDKDLTFKIKDLQVEGISIKNENGIYIPTEYSGILITPDRWGFRNAIYEILLVISILLWIGLLIISLTNPKRIGVFNLIAISFICIMLIIMSSYTTPELWEGKVPNYKHLFSLFYLSPIVLTIITLTRYFRWKKRQLLK